MSTLPTCGARSPRGGYLCTRPLDHGGPDHVADTCSGPDCEGCDNVVLERWSIGSAAPKLDDNTYAHMCAGSPFTEVAALLDVLNGSVPAARQHVRSMYGSEQQVYASHLRVLLDVVTHELARTGYPDRTRV